MQVITPASKARIQIAERVPSRLESAIFWAYSKHC